MSTTQPQIHKANPAIDSRGDIHIYLPQNATQPVPFVIGIHGGAWKNGDQTSYTYLWPKLQALGIGLVLLSYRVSTQARFPAAYEDLLHSLAWLKEHGSAQQLDTSRSVLFGGSAGGNLVMLLGSRVTAENLPAPQILGIINYCGIMDLVGQFAHDQERGSPMTQDFIGFTPEENPEIYRQASPVQHLHSQMPDVWMAHGNSDPTVPIEQSRAVVKRMRELGLDPIYHEAKGLGHTLREMEINGEAIEPLELLFERDVLRFIQRTFR